MRCLVVSPGHERACSRRQSDSRRRSNLAGFGDTVCRNATVDRGIAVGGAPPLASPLRQDFRILGRRLPGSVRGSMGPDRRGSRDHPHARRRVFPFHHSALGTLHRDGRDSHQGKFARFASIEHRDTRSRNGLCQRNGDNWRINALDPAVVASERRPKAQDPCGDLLYLPGLEHWWRPDSAGRSTAVSGFPEGRGFLLDVQGNVLADIDGHCDPARRVLRA